MVLGRPSDLVRASLLHAEKIGSRQSDAFELRLDALESRLEVDRGPNVLLGASEATNSVVRVGAGVVRGERVVEAVILNHDDLVVVGQEFRNAEEAGGEVQPGGCILIG